MEKLYFFMSALSQISKAECVLNHGHEFETINENYAIIDKKLASSGTVKVTELTLAERLEKAVSLYWKALATLKVNEKIYFNSNNIL